MPITINKLVVLHLREYAKAKGSKDPLQMVVSKGKALKLSTCMRLVYLFNVDQFNDEFFRAYSLLENHVSRRNQDSFTPTVFERFEGQKAYEFLLYWSLGGYNLKRTFADDRIRGDIRAVWDKKFKSHDLHTKEQVNRFVYIINSLLADSVNLSKRISFYERGEACASILATACGHCAWSRTNGLLDSFGSFDYSCFESNAYLEHLKKIIERAKFKLLKKVTFSETGTDVTFFKSRYSIGPDRMVTHLEGIKKQLEKWDQLLVIISDKIRELESNEMQADKPSLLTV